MRICILGVLFALVSISAVFAQQNTNQIQLLSVVAQGAYVFTVPTEGGGQAIVVVMAPSPQGAKMGVVDVFTRLNVRTGPSTDYEIIGKLYPGDPVYIIGEQNGWYNIRWQEKSAWVCGTYVRTSAQGIRNSAIAPQIQQYLGSQMAQSAYGDNPINYSGYSYNGNYNFANTNLVSSSQQGNATSSQNGGVTSVNTGTNGATNGVLNVPCYSQGRVGAKYPKGFCGPTAAMMALEYYGVKADVNYLGLEDIGGQTPAYVKGQGSKSGGLKDMLKHCGLKNTTLSEGNSLSDLKNAVDSGNPVIVGVNGNYGPRTSKSGHYLVVVGVTNDKVIFNDPGDGKQHSVPTRTFLNGWKQRNNRAIFCRQ